MADLKLFIGDKNLSSWSLRPWLLLRHAEIPFTEEIIRLDRETSKAEIAKVSPSGRVPCLQDGDLIIWDSLAICEYIADRHPEKLLWPTDIDARAIARAVSAEMHSSFTNLRTVWPMCFSREGLQHVRSGGVLQDIVRIGEIWDNCRRDFGAEGPFLFGRFSIADAMYAPVVSRFVTYGPIDLPDRAGAYLRTMWDLPAMTEWGKGARSELTISP